MTDVIGPVHDAELIKLKHELRESAMRRDELIATTNTMILLYNRNIELIQLRLQTMEDTLAESEAGED